MKDKGITLVSLVVTIIVLILLAGISLNLTLGEKGIITMAKRVKENTELAQIEEEEMLNELYTQIEPNGGFSAGLDYDGIIKLNEFKKAMADYIEEAGGIKPNLTADTITFGESIKGILAEVTKDATATEEDIFQGKTAYVNGKKITGTAKTKNNFELQIRHHHGVSNSRENAGRETYWETTVNTENLNTLNVNLKMDATYYSYVANSSYKNANVILHIYAYTSETNYIDLYGKKGTSLSQMYNIENYSKIRFYIKFDETANDYQIHSTYGIQVNYTNVNGTLQFS